MDSLSTRSVCDWIALSSANLTEAKAWLTDLDAPIGDSDHGVNMARGFEAAKKALDAKPPADVGAVFKSVAMTLISTVGGASGPLYGTFYLQAATKSAGLTTLDLAGWIECFEAGLNGVMARGKAQPNDKTMVDALTPALAALKAHAGGPLAEALQASAWAGEDGAKATIPLIARKGRASYLGERSAGHQDPGATSSAMLLQALAEIAKT
jgi:phosphoenolpyruvate---glycerone phosphotransferase subunit DhaL